jgi:hypothetical protein
MLSTINFWQSLNAQSSMLEMFSGSPISVSEVHPQKVFFLMLFTSLGRVIDVKLLHDSKALSPILLTPSGIITDFKFELSEVATPAWGLATSEVIYNLKNPQASIQTFEEGTK